MINKLRYLLLFVLFIGFFPSVPAFDNSSSAYEDTDHLQFLQPDFGSRNGFTYPDGTGLMQLQRINNVTLLPENNLYIRLLHPNGTLTKFTVPTYNTINQPHAFPLNDGYVLVTQKKDDQIVRGKLVDWNGQILQSDVMLTDGLTNNTEALVKATDKDFLVTVMDFSGELQWKIFSAFNSTGQITELYKGSITGYDNNSLADYSIFSTTEGSYGIATLEIVKPEKKIEKNPKFIHSSPQSFLYVRVAFLSSGSVTDVNVILTDVGKARKYIAGIRPLPYGGFLFLEWILNTTDSSDTYIGTVKASNGTTVTTFPFGPDTNLDSMIAKLAELIPIDSSRITTSRRNQPDPNASDQILFQVTFKPTEDLSQKTGQQIIDDLDDLIRNKAYNSFSQEHPTIYLDETYGFSPIANLWETYKFKLIGLVAALLILSIIYFFARRKYPEGHNFVVIKLALILIDLSLDIAFVLSSARNVPQIYTPRYFHP
ncbi:2004_t:CDS:2 [Paraglomus brasilianum]|uniref:2004_t:CDS:1 n=1 Tax=Paraglomus brasilianum TaxID=144538 RepID=A0A9N9CT17_9GLOM|nr:2004_t:CDS:2 [Paraglomus brasilianum]